MNFHRSIRAPGRAANAYACETCGAPLKKGGGRRARFCSAACRNSAFRAKKWTARYDGLGPLRKAQNNIDNSIACRSHFRDRAPRISGPPKVLAQELFRDLDWTEVISPDGVVCLVAQTGRPRR
jgi:hypothetical protein